MSDTLFVIVSAFAGLIAGLIIDLFLKSRGMSLLKNIAFGLVVGAFASFVSIILDIILFG